MAASRMTNYRLSKNREIGFVSPDRARAVLMGNYRFYSPFHHRNNKRMPRHKKQQMLFNAGKGFLWIVFWFSSSSSRSCSLTQFTLRLSFNCAPCSSVRHCVSDWINTHRMHLFPQQMDSKVEDFIFYCSSIILCVSCATCSSFKMHCIKKLHRLQLSGGQKKFMIIFSVCLNESPWRLESG